MLVAFNKRIKLALRDGPKKAGAFLGRFMLSVMRLNKPIKTKVRIPFIIENGVSGLVLTSFIGGLFTINGIFPKYFYIEDKSIIHSGNKKSFNLHDAKSILIQEIELSPIREDFSYDFYKSIGTEISLFLKTKSGEMVQILPPFLIPVQEWGKKDWKRFINELSENTKLPVEINRNPSRIKNES